MKGWIQCNVDQAGSFSINPEQEVQNSSQTFFPLNSRLNWRGPHKTSILKPCIKETCFLILYLPSLPHHIVSSWLLLILWLTSWLRKPRLYDLLPWIHIYLHNTYMFLHIVVYVGIWGYRLVAVDLDSVQRYILFCQHRFIFLFELFANIWKCDDFP